MRSQRKVTPKNIKATGARNGDKSTPIPYQDPNNTNEMGAVHSVALKVVATSWASFFGMMVEID
jgi:hypothetical protein